MGCHSVYAYINTLFEHFEYGIVLIGGNHPWMNLWYRGQEVLRKKVLHLTYKENNKKTNEVLRKLGKL